MTEEQLWIISKGGSLKDRAEMANLYPHLRPESWPYVLKKSTESIPVTGDKNATIRL